MKKLSRKLLIAVAVLIMLIGMLAGCAGKADEPAATPDTTAPAQTETPAADTSDSAASDSPVIGYIMGGPEEWQQAEVDGAQFAADQLGIELVVLNSDYTPEKEISNAEDLISKGVDAIIMFTVNAESGQKVAQMCNAAGIPLFLLDGQLGEGEGTAVTIMSYSFYDLGFTVGVFASDNWPGGKMIYITGLPGAGIVEDYTDGLVAGLAKGGDVVELVDVQPGDWDRAKTISVMESIIASGREFDIAFINNEDMATGGIQVLKENNMLDQVNVVATGGSQAGLDMIASGELAMTLAASPAYEGMYMVKMVMDYFAGKDIPEEIVVPSTPITIDNLDKAFTWVPDQNMFDSIFN